MCLVQTYNTPKVSPKPSFGAPWKVGDAVVGRENAVWKTSQSGHPCPCQNCSLRPPAERTRRGSLLNHPLCPPDDPMDEGSELNWTVCMFRCNLPPAHFIEWLWSFTCLCYNTGVEWTLNKSLHRELILEKKILPLLPLGIEPAAFHSQVWCSTIWLIL